MRTIFKHILACCALALCAAPITGCSDSDKSTDRGAGFWDVVNPVEGGEVSRYGETITVSFTTAAGWDIEPLTESWVEIKKKTNAEQGGQGAVQLLFQENNNEQTRSVNINISVKGYSKSLLCTLTQASANGNKIDQFLIEKMDERLRKEYLWNTAYKELADNGQITYKTSYDKFLYPNLVKLGETNIEDGGYYRDFSAARGQRYIYSNIQELGSGRSSASSTRVSTTVGTGMGPTLIMGHADDATKRSLSLGFVYLESPAAEAGLRRGDMITSVNGNELNASNCNKYQQELYTTTSGVYKLTYNRFKEDGATMVEHSTTVTVGSYNYNPVIYASLFQSQSNKDMNIGYLVYDSFDISAQEILEKQLAVFAEYGIKDLILDLRFNPGGSVAQCRYLASSIVGSAHYNDTFSKMTFVDGSEEIWSFGYGNPAQSDGLGQGPDLGLKRLFVICSENTASACEMLINSLKGIDFPVYTYGSRTEGKNVGMVTSQIVYDGRRFEFSPITFYVKNAKGFGDYADGFEVDHSVNNQNANWNDDIDTMFPYNPTEWANFDGADPALTWAIMNATTGEDPDFSTNSTSTTKFDTTRSKTMRPLANGPIKLKMGRYGNIIYGSTEDAR